MTLTPHHLYYLLSRFSELGIAVGPMDIRLESMNADHSHANYVSFLNEAQRRQIRGSDRDSIHSVSSIRSVMSSMSSLWHTLGFSSAAKTQARIEKQQAMIKEDLTYLYSAFTKIPCLRLSPDHKAPLIAGYEEFPFDSAVPLFVFKNVTTLEITDLDFRQFCGWDRIADNVRSLTLKRVNLEDPTDLLINIVLDDMDRRRKRSAKGSTSPSLPWPATSPAPRLSDSAASPESPPVLRQTMSRSPAENPLGIQGYTGRPRSTSPIGRPSGSRHGSSHAHSAGHSRSGTPKLRRSSADSVSSGREGTPRGSSLNLLSSMGILPMSKWRFLRHLSLADNGITTLTASSLSPLTNTLQSLDLSANHFAEVPDCLANLVALRALNLSNCMIDSLRSLARNPLPAITVINLRGNRLQSLAGIERLLSLERIDLRENQMNDPAEIARLTGIPNMTDIYVNRNPFTRTHSEHRITIFNLFRKTPGYIEDVNIDGQAPSSSERKALIDRAPEPVNVPVVQPEPEDDLEFTVRERAEPVIEDFVDPFYERRKSQELLRQQRRKSDFGISTSQRRRRATRRRVVELTENDIPPEPQRQSSEFVTSASHRVSTDSVQPISLQPKNSLTDDSTYGGSEVETTPVRRPKPLAEVQAPAPISPPPQLPHIDTTVTPPLMRAGTETLLVGQSMYNTDSEAYRQRIESLRNDFGNGWLSALSDEPWDNTPPLQPVRTPSQSIVSTGRTLG